MKTKKIYLVLILMISMISFTNFAYASSEKTITEMGNEWIQQGEKPGSTFNLDWNTTESGLLEIPGLLTGIGIFIAIAVGIILGIKFVTSSAEGKAEIKNLITPYIIGVIIVVGALTIWQIAIQILDI